jgi:hypothetical protein
LKGMWTPSQGFQRRTWQTLNPQDWEESSRKPGFGSQPARVPWLEVFFGHVLHEFNPIGFGSTFESLMPWQPKIRY